jgi:hypothetical protein
MSEYVNTFILLETSDSQTHRLTNSQTHKPTDSHNRLKTYFTGQADQDIKKEESSYGT